MKPTFPVFPALSAVLLLIGPLTGCPELDPTPTPLPPEPTPDPAATPPPAPPPPDLPELAEPDCSNGRLERVEYVVDGDTLELDNPADERVRLIGIDTPESYPEDDVQCYGLEAKAQTRLLVDEQPVCLTYDPVIAEQSNNLDQYGRTLAYVFFGDGFSRFLNAELVQEGFAFDYPYTKTAVFTGYFAELERYARDNDLGLWSACGY